MILGGPLVRNRASPRDPVHVTSHVKTAREKIGEQKPRCGRAEVPTYLPYLVRAEKGRVNDTVRRAAPPWHVHVGSAVPSLVYTTAAAVFTWMHANARCSHGTCRVRPMRRPCTTSTSPPFEPEEETALLEPSSHPSSTPSIPKVFAASPFPLPSSPSSPSLSFVSFFVFVLLDIVI